MRLLLEKEVPTAELRRDVLLRHTLEGREEPDLASSLAYLLAELLLQEEVSRARYNAKEQVARQADETCAAEVEHPAREAHHQRHEDQAAEDPPGEAVDSAPHDAGRERFGQRAEH